MRGWRVALRFLFGQFLQLSIPLFHQFCSTQGVCVCVCWCVRSQGWRRAELVARLVGSGIQNLFFCEACDGTVQQVTEEMVRGIDLNVFFGEFPCCIVRHAGHLRCDREKLRTPMLGIFAHYLQDRMTEQGANAEEATARALSTEVIEQDRERMFPSVFRVRDCAQQCDNLLGGSRAFRAASQDGGATHSSVGSSPQRIDDEVCRQEPQVWRASMEDSAL